LFHPHRPHEWYCPSGVESPAVPSEHNQNAPDQEDKLSGLVESYIVEKQLSWAPKETKNQQNYINTFIEHVGDKGLSEYTKADAVSFKTWLLGSGKSPTTINKYIQKLSLLFSWLSDHTEQTTDIFKGLKLKRVKEVNVRSGYTDPELKLFDSWAKEQEPWRMFIAMIGRYHGLRSNEACQLYSDDIEQVNSVWCFNIRATREDQSLKTEASQRLVPIHSKLLGAGFLDFVASRKGVRNLASRSADAAKQIKDVVTTIQKETEKIKESSDTVTSVINETKGRIESLSKLMNTFQKNSNRAVFEVESISNKIFMNLAKLDHVIYKNNLYQLIFGNSHNFKPVDHTQCRLGQWYNTGLGKQEFSFTHSYKGLDNPHSIVHKEANILANECSGHEISCSKELIENKIELVEKASEQVFIFLDRILEEKNEQVMKEAANKLFNEEK
jgi:hypothetical protein